jgi:hypothetical protein
MSTYTPAQLGRLDREQAKLAGVNVEVWERAVADARRQAVIDALAQTCRTTM